MHPAGSCGCLLLRHSTPSLQASWQYPAPHHLLQSCLSVLVVAAADPMRLAALARAARVQMEERAAELSNELSQHGTESSASSDDDIVRMDNWASLLPVGAGTPVFAEHLHAIACCTLS